VSEGDSPERSRANFLARRSFIELSARGRARAVLDAGTFRELLGPFDRIKSPWLPVQGIVAQADDGVVVARGALGGQPAVVAAIEGAYQGGSIGEVSGGKIAAALELARGDCERGRLVLPVLLLETGGVRLQEANLGLAAIAEIHAAIVALQRHVPVVGVVAGMVGCFGGMALAAGLLARLIVTRQARLGMNGPEVIEQEAGLSELDASDRIAVHGLMGGAQRHATGFADSIVEDDADAIAVEVRAAFAHGASGPRRSADLGRFLGGLARIDAEHPPDPRLLRHERGSLETPSRANEAPPQRGRVWLEALTGSDGLWPSGPRSVRVADGTLADGPARFIAVVPDPANRFPRARHGEVGLDEGWTLAAHVRRTIAEDAVPAPGSPQSPRQPRAIVAIVDVPGQAFGRREERLGIHLACAAAVDAYAAARLAGHPIVALIVGKAMSGAFLAHGYQASRILALDSPGVVVHAMGLHAQARVTRRSVAEIERLSQEIAPMAYDIHSYAKLGLLHKLIEGVDADAPDEADRGLVRRELGAAIADARSGSRDLANRLTSDQARHTRAASIEVRRRMAEQWDE
jgi:malonate decarboxylase beta subunit